MRNKICELERLLFLNKKKSIIYIESCSKKFLEKEADILLADYCLNLSYKNKKDGRYLSDGGIICNNYFYAKLIVYLFRASSKYNFNHNYLIGILCGIPLCCIKNYINHFEKDMLNTKKMVRDYKSLLKGEDIFGLGLNKDESVAHSIYINFIPCSPTCKKAEKILIKNYNLYHKLKK